MTDQGPTDARHPGETTDGGPAGPPPPPPPPLQPPGPPVPGAYGAPVAWAPPNMAPTGLEVPGAAGFRFGGVVGRFLAWFLDLILLGIVVGIVGGLASAAAGSGTTGALISTVIYLGIGFLYFAGLWTSEGRGTLGMRLMKLQVGNAFDGRILTMGQAARRWVALGLPLQALYLLPGAPGPVTTLVVVWDVLLLISTAISPTRQGLHDRFANSAIVQPVNALTPALACLVLLVLLVVLPLIALLSTILLGGQVSTILSSVGESI